MKQKSTVSDPDRLSSHQDLYEIAAVMQMGRVIQRRLNECEFLGDYSMYTKIFHHSAE